MCRSWEPSIICESVDNRSSRNLDAANEDLMRPISKLSIEMVGKGGREDSDVMVSYKLLIEASKRLFDLFQTMLDFGIMAVLQRCNLSWQNPSSERLDEELHPRQG